MRYTHTHALPYLAIPLCLLLHFPAYLLTSVALLDGNQAAPSCPIPSNHLLQAHTPQVLSSSQSPHATGLILSPASQPFLQKLVDKIKSGQFLLRREHLSDKTALMQQLEDIRSYPLTTLGSTRPCLREVLSLSTWCYCFLGYMAILMPEREISSHMPV